jgi:hypothetical protein
MARVGMSGRDYRVFVVGTDGRVVNRIDLVCVSDADARERAKLLVEVHPIELWEGARRIERFEPTR